ncbi:MAG: PD40 domain-containing protein [Myxococcales bacterium]|nr:PD40 domain-containing protein [Myxococcales bacterium]
MTPRARRNGLGAATVVAVALTAMALLPTCHAFSSLEDCDSDADCSAGRVCEPRAKRCVPRADASTAPDASDAGSDAPRDSGSDGPPGVPCEDLPWGEPVPVAGLEDELIVSARLSPDELTMMISHGVPPSFTDIYTVTRPDAGAPFRVVGPLPVVNEAASAEFWPSLSADGRLMFFESSRSRVPDDAGVYQNEVTRIWSASRVNVATDFDKPRLQTLFDVAGPEAAPYLHPSGRSVYFASFSRPGKGQLDVWVAEIDGFGVVTSIHAVDAVNTESDENAPVVTLDDRFLYHNRPGDGGAQNDVWVSRRAKPGDAFPESTRVAELSSADDDYPSWVSGDHCRFYLTSSRPVPGRALDASPPGAFHLFVATRKR